MKFFIVIYLIFISIHFCVGYVEKHEKMKEMYTWKQISYDLDGVLYTNSTDFEFKKNAIHFMEELDDSEKFFIQSNNVPIGFEVYKDKVFVTVPRRRYGIPSTLNYFYRHHHHHNPPALKPYPDVCRSKQLVSVYRPRVDACDRLWVVDTGHLEVPNERRQIKPPAIIIFDLITDRQILRHELNPSIEVNNRTSAGLTSITVDVEPYNCQDAFAYINDLATEGLVVYSLRENRSWRVDHPSFRHDEAAMNFTASGHIINWRDGIFSIALAERHGEKLAYYHPLVSTKEFAVSTAILKNQASLDGLDLIQSVGDAGPNTQRASHDFHKRTNVMFFANVAQSAVLCWHIGTAYVENNIQMVAQDSNKLGYISDLKVIGDEVWLLSNQIPKFIYGTQNVNETNYFIMRGSVHELIAGSHCQSLFKNLNNVRGKSEKK